jgi:hypothetical protein
VRAIFFLITHSVCFLIYDDDDDAEPERQFDLVRNHVRDLRRIAQFEYSELLVIVERNLGFEAEHMQRAFRDAPLMRFWRDDQNQRTGVITTDVVKHAAMTLTNVFLREHRLCLLHNEMFVAHDPSEVKRRIREQLEIYSLQYKSGETVFTRTRVALSGKVGGFKDDLVICIQLGLYWTESVRLSNALRSAP